MIFWVKKKASDRNLLIRNIETKKVLFEGNSTFSTFSTFLYEGY